MAIAKGYRFPIEFGQAFPKGLLLVGEIGPALEYQENKSRPSVQRKDEHTLKLLWKAAVMDPDEPKAKRASFEILFAADVQPVPVGPEVFPGMRPVELVGLTAEPRVMRAGDFQYQGYAFYATGIKGDTNAPASNSTAATKAAAVAKAGA